MAASAWRELISGRQSRQECQQGASVFRTNLTIIRRKSDFLLISSQELRLMDRYDTEILTALQMGGRMTWSQLATRVSLSASAVQRRVESLIDRGVIDDAFDQCDTKITVIDAPDFHAAIWIAGTSIVDTLD